MVRLAAGRLLEGAALEGVDQDGLCVALWRSSAGAWRLEHGMKPLTPQALASHAVLVALHPEGMEAVFGEDGANRLSLTDGNAVLAPTTSGYHLANQGGDPQLLVVVGTRREADARHREPARRAVAVGGDSAAGTSAGPARKTAGVAADGSSSEGQWEQQGRDPSAPEGGGVDVQALARIMAAAGPPTAEAM